MTYRIRSMEEADIEPTADLLFECYRERGGCYQPSPRLSSHFLAGSLALDGAFNRLAVAGDGQVVGYTCAIRPRGRVAGCGPTAIHPDHRGTGLYPLLLMNTVNAALEHGVGLLRHQVMIIPPIFGMVYARVRLTFTGETYVKLERAPRGRVPAPAAHQVRSLAADQLAPVVELDRARFADADRSRDFAFILEHMHGHGWALERGGQLRGFVFSIPGIMVGPLVAVDDAAAIDALRVATARDQEARQPSTININLGDRALMEEALRLGYLFGEMSVVMERSFDGGPLTPPRANDCLGLLGVP